MITPHRVWLNDKSLDDFEGIWIVGIDEGEPSMNISTEQRGYGDGTMFLSRSRSSLSVDVRFVLVLPDSKARAAVMDGIRGWCTDGFIQVSSRPGKRLKVRCTGMPSLSDLRNDTEFTISFTAFESPFWEEYTPERHVITNGSKSIVPVGTAEYAACEFEAVNKGSAVCNDITFTAGDTHFTFSDLGLAAGETLRCYYNDFGMLAITIDAADGATRSAYAKRTPDSSDDLRLYSGKLSSISASAANIECTFIVRGRWK